MKNTPLGTWLRESIHEHHTTMRAAAKAADLSHVTIHNTIWGVYTPRPLTCIKLAEFLNEDPDELLTLAGHRLPRKYDHLPDFATYVRRMFRDMPLLRRSLMEIYRAWMELEKAK